DVIFATQPKSPPDVTYIYKGTRTETPVVGALTTFELENHKHINDHFYVWIADHFGQIHRVLCDDKFTVHLLTLNTDVLDNSRLDTAATRSGDNKKCDNCIIRGSAESNGRIHFIKGRDIVEIDTNDTCAFYLNCGDCLNPRQATNDIVKCKWENGRCIAGESMDYCLPFVDVQKSGPFEGPDKGGQLLTLNGFDFGSAPANPWVKIGEQFCVIKVWSNSVIKCVVQGGDSREIKKVSLSFSDLKTDERRRRYRISTNGGMEIATYQYYPVEFHGVFPSYGPIAGGTHLKLFGLNIGSNNSESRYQLLGKSQDGEQVICDTFTMNSRSELACKTKQFGGAGPQSLNLFLEIGTTSYAASGSSEGSAELFVYRRNPLDIILAAASKLQVFFRGGRDNGIIFHGQNLDAAVDPRLEVVPFGYSVIVGTCSPNRTTIVCKAPSLIHQLGDDKSLNQPIHANMRLRMDNFVYEEKFRILTYHPNSTVNLANLDKAIIDPNGGTRVVIPGKNLSPLDKGDVTVLVYGMPCDISDITDTTIVCAAQLDPGTYEVEIAGVSDRTFRGSLVVLGNSTGMDWSVTIAIVLLLLALLITAVLVSFYYLRMRPKIEKNEPVVAFTPENDGYLHPDNERLLSTIPPDPEIIQQLSDWGLLMDFSCIQVGALIGKGQFGCVYRGVLKRDKMSEEEAVAVKTLQQRGYTTNDANVFLKEALRMKDFNHPNVLCLIGVSFDNNNSTDPMIIVPYMANGDLLAYIRNQDNTPTVKDLITFGANIAQGMSYLATQKFIHRDLAARNCMVGEDMIVRVADFGLSRDVYETSYYSSDNAKMKLPVKWMALESLIGGHYSHKSDVWSFGIVLWELMTRGCQPYPSVDNWEVHLWLKQGRRMLQPAYCPDALYKIMLQCWHEDPQERPTFAQLVKDVPNVIHTIEMATRNTVPQYVNA
ncbi:hepatocyte growth factor receptor-like, partial [Tropilaelaps mercedesae]